MVFGDSTVCHECSRKSDIRSGTHWYCAYHYRLLRIRIDAKIKGKTVPTKVQLISLFEAHKDMVCPSCKTVMNWLGRDGRKHVLTLQHNHNGSFGILCHSCNSAHQFIPNDGFYSKLEGTRYCQDCSEFLPTSNFFKDQRLRDGVKTYCKQCANIRTYKWRREVEYRGKSDWVKY